MQIPTYECSTFAARIVQGGECIINSPIRDGDGWVVSRPVAAHCQLAFVHNGAVASVAELTYDVVLSKVKHTLEKAAVEAELIRYAKLIIALSGHVLAFKCVYFYREAEEQNLIVGAGNNPNAIQL